jgi:hypothetical protein
MVGAQIILLPEMLKFSCTERTNFHEGKWRTFLEYSEIFYT